MEQREQEVGWGLYDEQDGCWMGDTEGPYVFGLEHMAEAAALVMSGRLRWHRDRIVVRLYDGSGTQMKDTVTAPPVPQRDVKTALRLMRDDIVGGGP